jgi:ankyrin repeat protein
MDHSYQCAPIASILNKQAKRGKTTTVKGTTQNENKREPNESALNMSRELSSALISLLRTPWERTIQEANVLIEKYEEEDLQGAVLEKDANGWLPIHCAFWRNAPLEVIQMLLDSDSDKKSIFEKTDLGKLPIHFACNHSNKSVEVIRLLLERDDENKTILEKDCYGQLPIHCACSGGATVEVIQLLLDSDDDKQTILVKNDFGQLPIHCACEGGATVAVIRLLLDSDDDKKTILVKDRGGQLPIKYACEGDRPVKIVQLLLQASIYARLEQLGLAQWRIGMEELINAMTEEDSKTKKVRQIYARLSKYEEMERTISSFSLAIWRTSCLKWGNIKFKSMQEMEDLRATDETFDPAEYKRERQIKSGADAIIRGVLPFLPVEDDDSDSESSPSDDGADLFDGDEGYYDDHNDNYYDSYGDY